MQLAVLLDEITALPVLEALDSISHIDSIVLWTPEQTLLQQLPNSLKQGRAISNWDVLLVTRPDGVLVAGTSADVVAAARQLQHAGVPLLVLTETQRGIGTLFQYMPLWQDHPDRIAPLFCSGVRATAAELLRRFTDAKMGKLWKVDFERVLQQPAGGLPGLAAGVIDQTFMQDLKWICSLGARPEYIHFQTSGSSEFPVDAVAVLGGREQAEVHWSLCSRQEPDRWRLKLTGTAGEMSARCTGDESPVLEMNGIEEVLANPRPRMTELADEIRAWIDSLGGSTFSSHWLEVVWLGEIGAAARRSLKRRRTIDLHYEEASERSQFKTQMTAIGCGALLWTMFGMISLLLVAALFDPRDRELRSSSTAGFIMHADDFKQNSSDFTPVGFEKITGIAQHWSSASPVLIVEQAGAQETPLDLERLEKTEDRLKQTGVRNPEERLILRPLSGRWFERLMLLGWGLVFGPLAVVVGLQLLIFVSRSQHESSTA